MGQKVNPIGFRLAVTKDWRSKWYAPEKEYADSLHSDLAIRKYLKDKLMTAAVAPRIGAAAVSRTAFSNETHFLELDGTLPHVRVEGRLGGRDRTVAGPDPRRAPRPP